MATLTAILSFISNLVLALIPLVRLQIKTSNTEVRLQIGRR